MNVYIQASACDECPFNADGFGAVLRESLNPGRFDGIKAELDARKAFPCHKTTHETGDGTNKVCAGALAYQRSHGCVPDELQVIERLVAMREGRKARW